MHRSSLLLASALLLVLAAGPALAEGDEIMQVSPCGVFCKIWRNLSGKAQVSFSEPIPSTVYHDTHVQAPEYGAEHPKVADLVSVHGTVIAETKADRARRLKDLAALQRSTAKPDLDARTADSKKLPN